MRWPTTNSHPRLKRIIQRTQQELLWLSCQLMPPHCPLCGTSRYLRSDCSLATLCDTCKNQLQIHSPDRCPRCDEPYLASSVTPHQCSQCLKTPPSFEWIKTAGIYTDVMSLAMNQFKYHGQPSLAPSLAQCIIDQLSQQIIAYQPDLIIPVPLHLKRLKERGYNQSLLLARYMGKTLNIPVQSQAMTRIRATQPQSLLNATKRHKNLQSAFTANLKHPPLRVLLVDDIVTTTSTARACSTVLVDHGHTVAVVALGRASLK